MSEAGRHTAPLSRVGHSRFAGTAPYAERREAGPSAGVLDRPRCALSGDTRSGKPQPFRLRSPSRSPLRPGAAERAALGVLKTHVAMAALAGTSPITLMPPTQAALEQRPRAAAAGSCDPCSTWGSAGDPRRLGEEAAPRRSPHWAHAVARLVGSGLLHRAERAPSAAVAGRSRRRTGRSGGSCGDREEGRVAGSGR